MTVLAIIQARMGSTRLPGKVLGDLAGRSALDRVVAAARVIPGVDAVVVATGDDAANDAIAAWCAAQAVPCRRGDERDVLARFVRVIEVEAPSTILRLTADCPLLDPIVCGEVLALHRRTGADYASNVEPPSWPDGLDCEAVTAEALLRADREAVLPSEREHVTLFLRSRPDRFKLVNLPCPIPGLAGERWSLDEPEDKAFLEALCARLPNGAPPSYLTVLQALEGAPDLRDSRAPARRNPAAAKAMTTDGRNRRSYARSLAMLERAEKVIPLGSQTFSKSRVTFPHPSSPLYLTHGDGGRVWDVDGNEYVDMVCGLLPVVLGYRDPDVDAAIRDQLSRGITFSLATEMEVQLAERLVEIVPCAEMVRFGKNGTDATSGAIRLARAHTGRDRIAVGGYHGWQDWYVGSTTRSKGVPEAVRGLTHRFPWGDLDALRALLQSHRGEFAAVIMEPMTVAEPAPGYLESLAELVRAEGALLIFDEIITGFRLALGGAQERYGVIPDLAAFGKSMANGMPISAVLGRAEVMREMEEVFLSGTFGGETLSLAAAIATIDKMRREPVIDHLWTMGQHLADGFAAHAAAHGVDAVVGMTGAAPWKLLSFRAHQTASAAAIKTFVLAGMLEQGVLINASHNVCYAHDEIDAGIVLGAYDQSFAALRDALDRGALESELPCPVIEPVFRVRET